MRYEGLLSELLADTNPGNAEVESEPAYMEMQVALEGKAGSQMGDAVIPAQPPNFKTASEICVDLLRRSKHLSLMVALAKAGSGFHGFQGLADSLALMHGVASAHWDDIYPVEDKDDPDDPWWERINLLRELADNPDMVDHLTRLEIVSVKHLGSFSKRDIDIAAGRLEGSDEEKERCNAGIIRGAFTESDRESLAATDKAMSDVIVACDNLEQLFQTRIGADAPSFQTLKARVIDCRETFREYAGDKLDTSSPEPEAIVAPEGEIHDTGQLPTISDSGTVRVEQSVVSVAFADRDSVAEAFDHVIRFYQQYEPSSPVPILLFRARQMVYKNFFDILRELAPQHKDNFRELMSTLRDDPLSFLLEHSYSSFLNGETFEVPMSQSSHQVQEMQGESAVDNSGIVSVNDPNTLHASHLNSEQVGESSSDSAITSRTQVVQTLKDIQKFFEIQEPSSPVPLIVKKVITIVPKTFIDLLSEFEVTSTDVEASG